MPVELPGDLPVIDVSALVDPGGTERDRRRAGDAIGRAAERFGFFVVVGHGVDPDLKRRLEAASTRFFAQPVAAKSRIDMTRGGAAWRGWFPVGEELTSGEPDGKEGLYFGTELPSDDPAVQRGTPLHGPNLFPDEPADLRPLVLEWMERVTAVGRAVLTGIARHLGLDAEWFDRWCNHPTVLFRIFHYPPAGPEFAGRWGVAEHTDYGLLTLLAIGRPAPAVDTADTISETVRPEAVRSETMRGDGLEIRVDGEWFDVGRVGDGFVCNIGDMLERATGGRLRSTPHRVALPAASRLSFPLFLDPAWDAEITPLPGTIATPSAGTRWDGVDVTGRGITGTYGDYLTSKVRAVFPELFRSIELD